MRDHTKPAAPSLFLLVGPFLGLGVGFLVALGEILVRRLPLSPFAAIAAPFYGGAGILFGLGAGVAALVLARRSALRFVVAGALVAFPVAAKLLEIVFEKLPHGISPLTLLAGLAGLVVWLVAAKIGAAILRLLPKALVAGLPAAAALAALVLVLLGSPEQRREIDGPKITGRPNVILILIDTLRADRLSLYGYPRPTSPAIDRLAEDGVLYANAFSQCSWTKPSVVSMLSSRYPFAFSRNDLYHRVPGEATLVSELFAAAGYRTGAIVANPVVSPSFGFDQGFETFDHGYLTLSGMRIYRYLLWLDLLTHPTLMFRGDVLAGRAIRWIDRRGDAPFFLYLHFMDPHEPYDPGAPYDRLYHDGPIHGRKTLIYPRPEALPLDAAHKDPYGDGMRELSDRYDGEVRRADDAIGRVLDHLRAKGLYDGAAIAVVADHGEEFLDHGGWGHGQSLYRELTGVPFVLKPPAGMGPRGVIETRRVMLVDAAPTLLALAGVAPDASTDGIDLLASAADRPAIGDVSAGAARIVSIRRGPYDYIRAARGNEHSLQLFFSDLDPGERTDRSPEAPAALDSLAFVIDSLTAAAAPIETEAMPLDEGTVEQLRGLGYLQ